jgi:hypothetical protein
MAVNKFVIWLLFTVFLLSMSTADAQQPHKIYKVGRLSAGSAKDPLSIATYDAFREGLRI